MPVGTLSRRIGASLAFLFVLGFVVDAYAQPRSWTGPRKRGRQYRVRIDSAPQQAAIYLEDEKHGIIGYTPWMGRLTRGNWKLIIKKDGYQTTEKKIGVRRTRRRQEYFVAMDKKEEPALIEVRPDADKNAFGSKVWVDGQMQGKVPVTLKVDEGRHLVEIKKEGFETFTQWIEVKEGQRATVNPMLKAIAEKETGNILVEADVEGAEVYLDGNKHEDATPTVLSDIPEGPHVVEVKKEPAPPWRQTITVVKGKTVKVSAKLESTMQGAGGNVRVLSNVEGARVFLDGTEVGEAPIDIKDVKPGEHVIEVRANGYTSREERVKVAAGSGNILKLDLNEAIGDGAVVKIVSAEPEAMVFIDGEEIGKAPQKRKLAAGEHFVVVQKEGFKKFEQRIVVKKDQDMTITAEFKAVGGLRFLSSPSGATILLNGEEIGQTPLANEEVPIGEHVVTLRLDGYYEFEEAVSVEGGKMRIINSDLKLIDTGPTPAELMRRQRGLTSYGARTMPKGNSTLDVGVGYPYFLDGRINVGAGQIAGRYGFDAGVFFRTFLSRSELGAAARINLLDKNPFAFGTFAQLGGGSSFFDDSDRNTFFADFGVAGSLTGLGAVTVTGRAYVNLYTDRHCPTAEANGDGTFTFDTNEGAADAVNTCKQVAADAVTPEKMSRLNSLFGEPSDIFDRDNGARLLMSLFIEIALDQRWNVWLLFEGVPYEDERAAYTGLFSGLQFEDDFGSYFRLGMTYKF